MITMIGIRWRRLQSWLTWCTNWAPEISPGAFYTPAVSTMTALT
jgi:hypothetical protein